jgi:hypothetical protein
MPRTIAGAPFDVHTMFNHALDIVDNREIYTGFLKANFGDKWTNVDVAEVQQKLTQIFRKYQQASGSA